MDQKEFLKKFIKFLSVSQVVGLFYTLKLDAWGTYFFFSFFLPLITAGALLYYFFKGVKMTIQYFVLGFMLYCLMGLLFFIPAYFGMNFFFAFTIWNFLYGIYLIFIVLGKKYLPQVIKSSTKYFERIDWKSKIKNFKNISFRQASIVVLTLLVIFASFNIWSGSRKKDRCIKLKDLAADYKEIIEDNLRLAAKYEKEGDKYLNRYGDVQDSISGAMASGVMLLHYNSKVSKYRGKLTEVENEMVELGCNR